LWAPLNFNDDVLVQYFVLMEKTLDALTFDFLDSYKINLVDLGNISPKLTSTDKWVYLVLIGLITLPVLTEIARSGWKAAGKGRE